MENIKTTVVCSHAFWRDITSKIEDGIERFGGSIPDDYSFMLNIYQDGGVEILDVKDGSHAGTFCELADFKYCPICGEPYVKNNT